MVTYASCSVRKCTRTPWPVAEGSSPRSVQTSTRGRSEVAAELTSRLSNPNVVNISASHPPEGAGAVPSCEIRSRFPTDCRWGRYTCGCRLSSPPRCPLPGTIGRSLASAIPMADTARIDLLDPADVARLGGIEIVAAGVVEGFLAGIHRSPFRGFSVEFTEHRAYQPGDELRYLDWRILARADRLFVKQFEEETNLRAMILVDASRSMAWRGAPARLTKRAYADRLAAALALILLRQRDATGLITFDEAVREVVPPRVRAGQWARLVRGLERTPDGGGTAAEAALGQLTSLLVRRGLVVLVSDLLFDRELALTALRYLRHRGHHVIVLHLMDPAEAELAGAPEVRFRDPESALSVVVRPRELARTYRETVRREIAAWRTTCRRHGIAYHHVLTDLPFGMALRLLT